MRHFLEIFSTMYLTVKTFLLEKMRFFKSYKFALNCLPCRFWFWRGDLRTQNISTRLVCSFLGSLSMKSTFEAAAFLARHYCSLIQTDEHTLSKFSFPLKHGRNWEDCFWAYLLSSSQWLKNSIKVSFGTTLRAKRAKFVFKLNTL